MVNKHKLMIFCRIDLLWSYIRYPFMFVVIQLDYEMGLRARFDQYSQLSRTYVEAIS